MPREDGSALNNLSSLWKHALCAVWGSPCPVHLHSCYAGTLIGDWWWGIFHRVSTSSSTPSLGLPLSPLHGALDEYDWQRWSPRAVTNYSSHWLPSWWINVYCVSRTEAPRTVRWECVRIWSCAVCTSLIIIFIDEYHCRQDDEVAICVRRLSHANMEPGLCHCREIWSCTDLHPSWLSNFFCTQTHTLRSLPNLNSHLCRSLDLTPSNCRCELNAGCRESHFQPEQPLFTCHLTFWVLHRDAQGFKRPAWKLYLFSCVQLLSLLVAPVWSLVLDWRFVGSPPARTVFKSRSHKVRPGSPIRAYATEIINCVFLYFQRIHGSAYEQSGFVFFIILETFCIV